MHTLKEPSSLLKNIYDSATHFAIITTDLGGKVTTWNIGAERILGFLKDDMIGCDLSRIFTTEDKAAGAVAEEIATAIATGRATDYRWHMRKNGCQFWADGMLTPILSDSNEIIGYLKILQDITERKTAHDEIIRLATVDPLTALANRRCFDTRTGEMIQLSARVGRSLQLFMIDLDRFKEVNDTHGHPAGDELLRQVASRLKGLSRESDFIGRLGGDEFGLLQIGPIDFASSGEFASKLVSCLADPFHIGDVVVQISASVGIASSPLDGTDPEELLKKADLALYKAKSAGRNRFHYFTDELDRIARKRRMDSEELRRVVSDRSFWLVYQPIVESTSGRATAMEALIRFPGPALSGYTVDYVIDLAREIGLISEIGGWVFGEACTQLRRWKDAGIVDLRISINTCAKELLDTSYLASIRSSLTQSGIAEADIDIELTERDAIDLNGVGSSVLQKLAADGFKLSLDDFGTGYSSLSSLRSLPMTTIKLDKSFLIDVPTDPDANAVTVAVISLAKALRLHVVAEGVEERKQAHFLQEMKCELFQGYLFSKPMPPIQATDWLLANRLNADRISFISYQ
ncbi:MAG: EAL domain-containing protein [Herminiimonas sp.]|uniref:putative bifunctional diguanylate cyclase/phosphodiesterase n=1 Tax=Herminiimonas sp. TaxID=1926289 RepID=UPI00272921FD|nr:EAL domain-containing protein [Herminiimonas sp.]MDO9422472.1 EAL domain-containing protein [Herminiimonas sp.]